MNLMQLQPNLSPNIPPQRGANDTRSEEVKARFFIAHHDGEILRDILDQDLKGILGSDIHFRAENTVMKDPIVSQREVLRIPRAHKLQYHLHQLFTG